MVDAGLNNLASTYVRAVPNIALNCCSNLLRQLLSLIEGIPDPDSST